MCDLDASKWCKNNKNNKNKKNNKNNDNNNNNNGCLDVAGYRKKYSNNNSNYIV